MSELLPVLAVILVVLGLIEKKHKFTAAKRGAQPAQAAPLPPRQEAAQPMPVQPAPPPAPLQPRVNARIATEGEDPCHAYMLDEPLPSQGELEPENEARADARGQELVRSMVLGEIMRRPERRPWGRRRA